MFYWWKMIYRMICNVCVYSMNPSLKRADRKRSISGKDDSCESTLVIYMKYFLYLGTFRQSVWNSSNIFFLTSLNSLHNWYTIYIYIYKLYADQWDIILKFNPLTSSESFVAAHTVHCTVTVLGLHSCVHKKLDN